MRAFVVFGVIQPAVLSRMNVSACQVRVLVGPGETFGEKDFLLGVDRCESRQAGSAFARFRCRLPPFLLCQGSGGRLKAVDLFSRDGG